MSRSGDLDLRSLLNLAALDILRLALLTPSNSVGVLSSQRQNVPSTEAVASAVDTSAVRNRVGKLLLGALDSLVEDRKHLLGGVACEPHVQHECLGRLGQSELELLDEARLLIGRHRRIGSRVALEPSLSLATVCRASADTTANSLVGHHHEETLLRILVCLNLVVRGLDARAAGEEE